VRLVADTRAEWRGLDVRIDAPHADLVEHARNDAAASRLLSTPGIGVLGATALIDAVGDGEAFRRARDLPAWLGLVPKQVTTGGAPKLLGVTKRGNTYLRMSLIHGARAALPGLAKQPTALGAWLRSLLSRAHRHVVIVALAGKLARIAWAVIKRGVRYERVWSAPATA
jgi:transposase